MKGLFCRGDDAESRNQEARHDAANARRISKIPVDAYRAVRVRRACRRDALALSHTIPCLDYNIADLFQHQI